MARKPASGPWPESAPTLFLTAEPGGLAWRHPERSMTFCLPLVAAGRRGKVRPWHRSGQTPFRSRPTRNDGRQSRKWRAQKRGSCFGTPSRPNRVVMSLHIFIPSCLGSWKPTSLSLRWPPSKPRLPANRVAQLKKKRKLVPTPPTKR